MTIIKWQSWDSTTPSTFINHKEESASLLYIIYLFIINMDLYVPLLFSGLKSITLMINFDDQIMLNLTSETLPLQAGSCDLFI